MSKDIDETMKAVRGINQLLGLDRNSYENGDYLERQLEADLQEIADRKSADDKRRM